MTDIPEELVERVAKALFLNEHPNATWAPGRLRWVWWERSEAAIRAVLDWRAKEWVEIPRLDRQHPSPARVTPQGK